MRLWPIFQVFRLEAVLDQLPVGFLVSDYDRPRVRFDDLPFETEVPDKHVVSVS
jgi:hypothetical protein